MVSRRHVIQIGALGVIAPAVLAQARQVRVGMLSAITKSFFVPHVLQRLAELGYRDGSTMVFEFRSAEGKPERFPPLAEELLQLKCDLIFAIGSENTMRALLGAPASPPVVFLAVEYDPVERGIVASLARPGGNATGVYAQETLTTLKRLELAREIIPRARRFLTFADTYSGEQINGLRKAAEGWQIQLTVVQFSQQPYAYKAALETGRRAKANALILPSSPVFADGRADILAAAMAAKMPLVGFATPEAIYPVGYAVNPAKAAQRVAEIGVRVLKGAKPGDIPVERAQEFDLQVNLKSAKALGMQIPNSVLARATQLIE